MTLSVAPLAINCNEVGSELFLELADSLVHWFAVDLHEGLVGHECLNQFLCDDHDDFRSFVVILVEIALWLDCLSIIC